MLPPHPALVGLVEQVPRGDETWTNDQREDFLEAFQLVLDFCVSTPEARP